MDLSKITESYRRFFLEFDLTRPRTWLQLVIIGLILFAYIKWLRWWFKNKMQHRKAPPEALKEAKAKRPFVLVMVLTAFYLMGEQILTPVRALLICLVGSVLIDRFVGKKRD
jgi:hypothetical protein